MAKRLVYNAGNTPVVYDAEGLMIAPGEWQYTDGNHLARMIEIGTLTEVSIPDRMPNDVTPGAYEALREAFDDKQKSEPQPAPEPAEAEVDAPVRNTGAKSTRSTAAKSTSKEA